MPSSAVQQSSPRSLRQVRYLVISYDKETIDFFCLKTPKFLSVFESGSARFALGTGSVFFILLCGSVIVATINQEDLDKNDNRRIRLTNGSGSGSR